MLKSLQEMMIHNQENGHYPTISLSPKYKELNSIINRTGIVAVVS